MERLINFGTEITGLSSGVLGTSFRDTMIISTIGSVATFMIGAWDLPFKILFCAVVIDYLSGTLKAWYLGKKNPKKGINSKVGFIGLLKKISIFFIIAVAQLTDTILGMEIIRNAICIAYAINEMYSVCENVAMMDMYVPAFIKDRLAQIQQQVDDMGKPESNKDKKDD